MDPSADWSTAHAERINNESYEQKCMVISSQYYVALWIFDTVKMNRHTPNFRKIQCVHSYGINEKVDSVFFETEVPSYQCTQLRNSDDHNKDPH